MIKFSLFLPFLLAALSGLIGRTPEGRFDAVPDGKLTFKRLKAQE